jgi:hypothetical protein
MSHQIFRDDFKGFIARTMLASSGTKRLTVVAGFWTDKVYYIVRDCRNGDIFDDDGTIVYDFVEAIDLYNSNY